MIFLAVDRLHARRSVAGHRPAPQLRRRTRQAPHPPGQQLANNPPSTVRVYKPEGCAA
jgi:hypothetical protein